MLNRPPRHRVDAVPVYIDPGDPAWDWDRVIRERKEMEAQKKSADHHPVTIYLGGASRFDLEATYPVLGEMRSAKDYVDMTQAWCFTLRRLTSKEWYSVKTRQESAPDEAYHRACQLGLVEIDGPDAPAIKRGPGGVTDECMDQLFHGIQGGPFLIPRIGQAVYIASMPLMDIEGKP